MKDSTRRTIRTALDSTAAILASLLAVVAFPGLSEALGLSGGELVRAGVICGAVLLFVTKLKNALEDRGAIPALLKSPASSGANPVPDDPAGGAGSGPLHGSPDAGARRIEAEEYPPEDRAGY